MGNQSWMWVVLCFVGVLWCANAAEAAAPAVGSDVVLGDFEEVLEPFVQKHCVSCHGEKKQKGKRRFDSMSAVIEDDDDLIDYQDILDQLNLAEMPPEDEEQPSVKEQLAVVGWLTDRIGRFHLAREGAGDRPVLRRLNAREYRNTIRDLLHVDTTSYNPTEGFPRDQIVEQLDNVGESLVTSGFLLQRYLGAADIAVRKAMKTVEKPRVQTWKFSDNFDQQPEINQVLRLSNYEELTLYEVVGADKHEGAYGHIKDFAAGVPHDGYYEIRFKANAMNRLNPYDPKLLGYDPSEPFRLGLRPGDRNVSRLYTPQPNEPLLTELELKDGVGHYSVRVWLDAGYTPRFTFRNGPIDIRNLFGKIVKLYKDQLPKPRRSGIVENRYLTLKHGKMPQIRIDDIEIEGPFYDSWPTAGQRVVLGTGWSEAKATGAMSESQMRESLGAFAEKAYRRPLRDGEVDRLMGVVSVRKAAGRSGLEAYGDGLKAVLCSPHFLYLAQADEQAGEEGYALAARLSYFLWSSMPDDELMKLAASGKLMQVSVLADQVDRLLNDDRSDAFIEGFLGSWLRLRELGTTTPDRGVFRAFYMGDLGRAMREETRLFTRELLDENLDVVNFIDSEFTYVNRPLARLYDLELPKSSGFERVALTDKRRGGLLGQASVMTVTANGIDTSPVNRGIWLLENILGTPPTPPPPDVEPLDPDIRGATTIRDQMRKHRENPTCYDCHRKIDPLGFALENYNPIGGWRSTYGKSGKVDASGELPSGEAFDDIVGLKEILVERRDQFEMALADKLLGYATGRRSGPGDRPHLDGILKKLDAKGNGFRDLVKLVVLSEPFRGETVSE